MRCLRHHDFSRLLTTVPAAVLAAVTILLVPACDKQNDAPTAPIPVRVRPQATILGTDVVSLPIDARDINDAGHIAGTGASAPGASHAALWTLSAGIRDLGTLGGTYSNASAINESDQIVGSSAIAGDREWHAFLWTPAGGMQDLGTLGGDYSIAQGINDAGQVVGYSRTAVEGVSRAFLWTASRGMQDLGTLGGESSWASDINNAGQVVGLSVQLPNSGNRHAFLWTMGQGMQDLGTIGGTYSNATSINELGHVTGFSSPAGNSEHHAFLWTSAQGMRDLGTLSGVYFSAGNAINDAGQIVGYSSTPQGEHAMVWTLAGGMEDLFATTQLMSVAAINNRGQIVAGGRLASIVTQTHRAPAANPGGPYTGIEGSAVTFSFSGTDLDGDTLTYAWNLGDGTTGFGAKPLASHVYADDGTYVVALTVSNAKGTDTKMTTVTIANVAPTIPDGGLTGPAVPIPLTAGTAVAPITLAFTDPADTTDRYFAVIWCGDGTRMPLDSRGASPFTATCTYSSAGVYTVRATVTDDFGSATSGTSAPAFYRYVVVYDPNGPSATGNGFYDVPGQGKRKTHFTFSVGFLSGQASTPNGKAKVWTPGGDMDFQATAIEMLVASGNRAQFWGIGTLNGAPARFRITAVAGSEGNKDAFRIELWQAGTLVFDSQPGAAQDAPVTTEIDGGNIQIHPR